jgi:hypothetical protein
MLRKTLYPQQIVIGERIWGSAEGAAMGVLLSGTGQKTAGAKSISTYSVEMRPTEDRFPQRQQDPGINM